MALTIVTKKRFENRVKAVLEYLSDNWYDSVADDFMVTLKEKIKLLSEQPLTGRLVYTNKNLRTCLVTKHNRIYYRVEKNNLIIMHMIDTRKNPKNNPFNKTK
jgi:plasmid stabilization system protein ParE